MTGLPAKVPLGGVLVGVFGVLLDRQARLGYSRGVGERQVCGRLARLGGDDFDLPFSAARVVVERVRLLVHVNGSPGIRLRFSDAGLLFAVPVP